MDFGRIALSALCTMLAMLALTFAGEAGLLTFLLGFSAGSLLQLAGMALARHNADEPQSHHSEDLP